MLMASRRPAFCVDIAIHKVPFAPSAEPMIYRILPVNSIIFHPAFISKNKILKNPADKGWRSFTSLPVGTRAGR
jgi:hypothetical protein